MSILGNRVQHISREKRLRTTDQTVQMLASLVCVCVFVNAYACVYLWRHGAQKIILDNIPHVLFFHCFLR